MYTMHLKRTPVLSVASFLFGMVVAATPFIMAAAPASSSSAEEIVYLRTRTQSGTASPIKQEVWVKVNSQDVISKAHAVVKDSNAQVLVESFYDAGSEIKTRTPQDAVDDPVYENVDAGVQKVHYNQANALAALQAVRGSGDWTVMSDANGLVTFQRSMGANIHQVAYNTDTGMVMRTSLYSVGANGDLTLIEELVVEHYERRAIEDGDDSAWTPILPDIQEEEG